MVTVDCLGILATRLFVNFHRPFPQVLSHWTGRFEDIYNKTARSGEFALHPLDPMYGELHPVGPIRHGCDQVKKVSPLCLKMAASFRRLGTEKFLKWFRMTYWQEYVVGQSGVGFDDFTSIEQEEKLFRQFCGCE